MRDINFRLWDKIQKEMYQVVNIDFADKLVADEDDTFYDFENIELMQYTGLKDKNGVEIYEGDVVRMFNDEYKVVFECSAFMLASIDVIDYDKLSKKILEYTGCDNKPYFCMNDNVVSLWEIYWNFNEEEDTMYCCEVIGNIYESKIEKMEKGER